MTEVKVFLGEKPTRYTDAGGNYHYRVELPDGEMMEGTAKCVVPKVARDLLVAGKIAEDTIIRVFRGDMEVFLPAAAAEWGRLTFSEGQDRLTRHRHADWQTVVAAGAANTERFKEARRTT